MTSRLIDRSIRPLFPKAYKKEVQVIATAMSVDLVNSADIVACIGTSAAVLVSDIPFKEPVATVKIGSKDGKLIVLDYKTRGYPVKDDSHTYYQNQLDSYNFLLRKKGYETEDFAFLLFYHPLKVSANGEIKFHAHLKKIPTNPENAETAFMQAIKSLNGAMPKASGECAYCKYREKIAHKKGKQSTLFG